MTDLRKAAQQALEALKNLFGTPENWESGGVAVWKLGGSGAPRKAIAALEATLEQAEPVQKPVPQAESVGEVVEVNNDGFRCEFSQRLAVGTKLYTAPPQRPWQGLTEQDMPSGENPMFDHQYFIGGMVYAAKVLQEKNNG